MVRGTLEEMRLKLNSKDELEWLVLIHTCEVCVFLYFPCVYACVFDREDYIRDSDLMIIFLKGRKHGNMKKSNRVQF